MRVRSEQPWIYSKRFDLALILGPPLFATTLVLMLGKNDQPVTPLNWLLLVVGIDVAHVYSTLFRTYLDKEAMASRAKLFFAVPFFALIGGVLLFSLGELVFWRTLAYLAVFHFVRQQYGFMRIYSRNPQGMQASPWVRRLEALAIYAATIYPLIHWHSTGTKNFHWFVEGDFLSFRYIWMDQLFFWLYCAIMGAYITVQAIAFATDRTLNLPKNLVVLGTALSWYVGVVWFDGDWTFTLANVVSHGVPYTALIWATQRQKLRRSDTGGWSRQLFRLRMIPMFALFLILCAYTEEFLWDSLVWGERLALFPLSSALPKLTESPALGWVVPILAVPQMTHYIIDAFIWRRHHTQPAVDTRKASAI